MKNIKDGSAKMALLISLAVISVIGVVIAGIIDDKSVNGGTYTLSESGGSITLAVDVVDATTISGATLSGTTIAGGALANGKVLVGNASSEAVEVAVSGDVAISNAGEVTIQAGAITEGKLSTAVQDKIAYVTIAVVDSESAGTGTVTIQLKDANSNDLATRAIVETWIGNDDDYLPDAQTDYSVSTGGSLQEIVTNAHYKAVTDTNGVAVMAVNCGGASTNYIWASVGGRITASGAVIFTAP